MADETSQPITPEYFLPDLLHARKSSFPSRFGILLNQICQDSDISQHKLGHVAREKYAELIDAGHIRPGENLGSMKQSVISLVFNSKQDATPAQVYIWIEALKSFPKFHQFCTDNNLDEKELETNLWNTTDYKSPDELAKAFEFARSYVRLPDPKSKVPTTGDLDPQEKDTDIEMPAIHEPNSDSLHNATSEVRRALEEQH